jgi:hypothetical protein
MKKSATKVLLTQIGSTRKKSEVNKGFDSALKQLGVTLIPSKKELAVHH